jgi:hypothetical protein
MDRKPIRNMLEFYSKNKFEKLVHLVGFIITINHRFITIAECQSLQLIWLNKFEKLAHVVCFVIRISHRFINIAECQSLNNLQPIKRIRTTVTMK